MPQSQMKYKPMLPTSVVCLLDIISKLLDTLNVFLKEFFEKNFLKENQEKTKMPENANQWRKEVRTTKAQVN